MTEAEAGRPFQPNMSWQGVRVTIVGLAREGTAVARFLAARGAEVIATDMKPAEALAGALAQLRSFPIRYALGGHPDWVLDTDIIFVSPGVPRTIPLLVEAARRGIRLSSETELFFSLCPAPIIGITGSSGKTTTTTLVGEILRAAGERTWVGGNIGDPLLNYLEEMGPDDRVVMELSSFQLEHLRVSPHIAAILNITPNHLDRHESMEAYINAKRQIVAHQGAGDMAVFGWDDPAARRLGEEYSAGQAVWFSGSEPRRPGTWVEQGAVLLEIAGPTQRVCELTDIRLRGAHNLLNVLAACAIAGAAGAPADAMRAAVRSFQGVPHRLELVREWNGVQFVNDSIATSPERAMAALRSFDEPIILLAGGRDKHLPWEEWADLVLRKARGVILFGEAAGLIERALQRAFERANEMGCQCRLSPENVRPAVTLERAVQIASEMAEPGDVVLLSPGGTSYDAYTDFVERGEHFRKLVKML